MLLSAIKIPMAWPMERLLVNPRRNVATSSQCAAAVVATVANAPNTTACCSDSLPSASGTSENTFSAPMFARSTGTRMLIAPRTGVSAITRDVSAGQRLVAARSASM